MTTKAKRIVLGPADGRPSQSFPEDHLERGASRLRAFAWLAMAGSAGILVTTSTLGSDGPFGVGPPLVAKQVVVAIGLLASAALLAVLRVKLAPRRVMALGLGYYALFVGLLGAYEASSPFGEGAFAHGIPTPCIPVVAFPMVVPVPPRRYIVASLAGASLIALSLYLVPALMGQPAPSLRDAVLVIIPVLVLSVVGTVAAGVIYRLGRDLKQARKMGSYQLIAPLGHGGMGEVWRAKHGMLARDAAVKLIRFDPTSRQAPSAEVFSRFENEARVVANLRSPHTIQLWDFGVTAEGSLYYAMELLDGMDLDKLVSVHGPVPPERAVHYLVQACHSLAEAHEAGHVHRDIKPANLFAAKLGRDVDMVKLLDFGLATRPVLERLQETRVTLDGMIMGTPAFMAPEQALGESELDGRADLYSLGVVAWWLLTGRDLFKGGSATQVMFAHVYNAPEAPSVHAPHPIPPELDAIVLRCLAKKPEERYQNAEDLAAALRGLHLAAPWTRARALAWWSRIGGAEEVIQQPAVAVKVPPRRVLADTVQAGRSDEAGP